MLYKLAICDDDINQINYLEKLVISWADNRNILLKIDKYSSAEEFLFNYEEDKSYNLLLLDIEMKNMDGITLAKKIREDNKSVEIVFITGYSDYIAEGYDVFALHYLMKPIDEEKLFKVLDIAKEKSKVNEKALYIEKSGQMIIIPIYEIKYLEVNHNYVTIHAKEDYEVKRTLSEFENELGKGFYRIGRGQLVNLKLIKRVTKKEVYLLDGTQLSLPRGSYDGINRAIIESS